MTRIINYALPKPRTRIEFRRWWNQICINALTEGKITGCIIEQHVICSRLITIDAKNNGCIPCNKCEHEANMFINENSVFADRFELL